MGATRIRTRPLCAAKLPRLVGLATRGYVRCFSVFVAILLLPGNAFCQDARAVPAAPSAVLQPRWVEVFRDGRSPGEERAPASKARRAALFLLGGAAGLGLHEGGHLLFDGVFGVRPALRRVDFGGIPFFAITHRAGLAPRREFTISSAGFWMQHLSSEVILTRHPRLASEASPVRKGILAFNVLASVAYGAAAMAKAGPAERDTRGMADALGVGEPWVGGLVLAPAGLDAWRYFHPDACWAKWLSRGVKIGMVVLVAKAGS